MGSAETKTLLGTKDKMVTLELRFLSVGSQRENMVNKPIISIFSNHSECQERNKCWMGNSER